MLKPVSANKAIVLCTELIIVKNAYSDRLSVRTSNRPLTTPIACANAWIDGRRGERLVALVHPCSHVARVEKPRPFQRARAVVRRLTRRRQDPQRLSGEVRRIAATRQQSVATGLHKLGRGTAIADDDGATNRHRLGDDAAEAFMKRRVDVEIQRAHDRGDVAARTGQRGPRLKPERADEILDVLEIVLLYLHLGRSDDREPRVRHLLGDGGSHADECVEVFARVDSANCSDERLARCSAQRGAHLVGAGGSPEPVEVDGVIHDLDLACPVAPFEDARGSAGDAVDVVR